MSQENIDLVKEGYAAFARGDIEAILADYSDDIIWEPVIGAGPHVPTAGIRRGKAAVREFFRILAETTDFERFEAQEFIAQGDKVVVLGTYAAIPRSTGRRHASDWVMVFTIADGRVVSFREFSDSAGINAAYDLKAAAAGR
jgi:ketosteroid isomerase-like protein